MRSKVLKIKKVIIPDSHFLHPQDYFPSFPSSSVSRRPTPMDTSLDAFPSGFLLGSAVGGGPPAGCPRVRQREMGY